MVLSISSTCVGSRDSASVVASMACWVLSKCPTANTVCFGSGTRPPTTASVAMASVPSDRESGSRGDLPTSSTVSSRIGTGQPGRVGQKARSTESIDVLDDRLTLDRGRTLTLVGIIATALASFTLGLDIGVVAITAAVLLSLVSGEANKAAVAQIAWPTVLLITGIVTYVGLMQRIGTIDWLGNQVAGLALTAISPGAQSPS
jgi:hypothetical protein